MKPTIVTNEQNKGEQMQQGKRSATDTGQINAADVTAIAPV